MSLVCSFCGGVNRGGARYCDRCGRSIETIPAGQAVTTIPFVGRERELTALRARLEEAARGKGSLAMLVGEAGIGKTHLAREFAGAARTRGAVVLWSSCFEGDWSPPYGPWVEALGGYARSVPPDQLTRELGAGAASLAQLIPEIRDALPSVSRVSPLSSDEERFRLYDAVAQFLLAIAGERLLVVVLDDLHWADRDSLRLLRHVARFLVRASVLIVGAFRDRELDRNPRHPLAETLVGLRREIEFDRLVVRGFSPSEVAQYLAQSASHQTLPRAVVDAIYAETAGNPFYTREVLRHLLEEGKVVHRNGRWSTDFSIAELGIPAGVRDVVGQRLARLSDNTNRALRLAAAFSGGFDFSILQAVADLPDEELLDSIDEALNAGLIQVVPGPSVTYDFVHAIVRHTLYDDLNPDRRARLHRRIAFSLEQVHGERAVDHAAEVATQYHASVLLPGARRGIRWCLAAAEKARTVHARERCVVFLRMARDLSLGEPPTDRATILGSLAIAEADGLLLDEALASIEQTLAAQTEAGTVVSDQAGFLAAVTGALKEGGASHTVCEPLVARGLALVGEHHDLVWARLKLLADRLETETSGPIKAGRWLGHDPEAVSIARSSGDEDDYARTLQPFDWRTRAETDAVAALARAWHRPGAVLRALDLVARDCIYHHGTIPEAVELLQELFASSARFGSIPGQAEALVQLALCEAILGNLPRADDTIRRAQELILRLGSQHRLRVVVETAVASVLAYLRGGDWPILARAATDLMAAPLTGRSPLGLTSASFATYNIYRAGNEAEARQFLAAITPLFERLGPRAYIYNGSLDRSAATVWELGATEYAPVYRRLAHGLLGMGEEGAPFRSNALNVARMAALLGDHAEARAFFARARVVLDESTQWPLRALVEYDEALSLIRAGSQDLTRIMGLVNESLTRFRALGMADWVERAQAQQERLTSAHSGARPKPAYPDRLTAREVAVLRLIAAGQTNKEIAADLVVSIPTVQRHIANIYSKIDARGRADATTYAISRGLVSTRIT